MDRLGLGCSTLILGDEMAPLLLVSSEEAASCCLTDSICSDDCDEVV